MTDLIEKPALAINRALCKANPSFQHSAALDMRALRMAATACIETILDLDEEAIEAAATAYCVAVAERGAPNPIMFDDIRSCIRAYHKTFLGRDK